MVEHGPKHGIPDTARSCLLKSGQLRWRLNPDSLPFETTDNLTPSPFTFCQPRAEKALELGIRMKNSGHIFLCGSPGTARKEIIETALGKHASPLGPLQDYLSVWVPKEPLKPMWISVTAGTGRAFQEDVDQCLAACQTFLRSELSNLIPDLGASPNLGEQSLTSSSEEAKARFEDGFKTLGQRYCDPQHLDYFGALKEALEKAVKKTLDLVSFSSGPDRQGPDPLMLLEGIDRLGTLRPRLVREAPDRGAPLIVGPRPTLSNLFGHIVLGPDRSVPWLPEPVFLEPGSLMKTQGGFLALDFEELIREPEAWKHLKRCLKYHRLENPLPEPAPGGHLSFSSPESIALQVRLIVWGDEALYQEFYENDPDFAQIFKVRAELDTQVDRNEESIHCYLSFLKQCCQEEGLLPFDRTGAAALIEAGAELAGRQWKLITSWEEVADITREASYWAGQAGSPVVQDQHVLRSMNERAYRINLPEEQQLESIRDGSIEIHTTGTEPGQVNGLALYETEDHLFGKPFRITVQTGIGRAGVVNIEREANLSGKIHDKGILILCGYLRERHAQNKPLNLSASICIEQFYADIDGDSASLGEICALLSSLGRLPVLQGIAVTGSISQKGEVQPVGCVNEKIRGFYQVCREKGLDGEQGVIIPAANVQDLMLPPELITDVEKGDFRIYAVKHISQAMEILTGREFGQQRPDGHYPPGSVSRLIDDRLLELAIGLRDFYGEPEEIEEQEETSNSE